MKQLSYPLATASPHLFGLLQRCFNSVLLLICYTELCLATFDCIVHPFRAMGRSSFTTRGLGGPKCGSALAGGCGIHCTLLHSFCAVLRDFFEAGEEEWFLFTFVRLSKGSEYRFLAVRRTVCNEVSAQEFARRFKTVIEVQDSLRASQRLLDCIAALWSCSFRLH